MLGAVKRGARHWWDHFRRPPADSLGVETTRTGLAPRLVRSLNQHGANRMCAKSLLMALLLLDEVALGPELSHHVGRSHSSPVSLVEEMSLLIL